MNEDKLILSKYSSGYFVSSVKENEKWNNIEQRYKISKEIYEDIEQLQNNWNELKKWLQIRNKCFCEEEILEKIEELEGNNENTKN